MSEHAEFVAERIDRYLAINGAKTVGAKIVAIRTTYGRQWRRHLAVPTTLTSLDVADGVDLLLSRLLDIAQAEYEAAMTVPSSAGAAQPAVYYLKEMQA